MWLLLFIKWIFQGCRRMVKRKKRNGTEEKSFPKNKSDFALRITGENVSLHPKTVPANVCRLRGNAVRPGDSTRCCVSPWCFAKHCEPLWYVSHGKGLRTGWARRPAAASDGIRSTGYGAWPVTDCPVKVIRKFARTDNFGTGWKKKVVRKSKRFSRKETYIHIDRKSVV